MREVMFCLSAALKLVSPRGPNHQLSPYCVTSERGATQPMFGSIVLWKLVVLTQSVRSWMLDWKRVPSFCVNAMNPLACPDSVGTSIMPVQGPESTNERSSLRYWLSVNFIGLPMSEAKIWLPRETHRRFPLQIIHRPMGVSLYPDTAASVTSLGGEDGFRWPEFPPSQYAARVRPSCMISTEY